MKREKLNLEIGRRYEEYGILESIHEEGHFIETIDKSTGDIKQVPTGELTITLKFTKNPFF